MGSIFSAERLRQEIAHIEFRYFLKNARSDIESICRSIERFVKQAGIDPVYFGVLFIINDAIGLITPPVSVVLNVVCGVSRISMETVKGVWPFLIAQLIELFLMVLFPSVVTVPAK